MYVLVKGLEWEDMVIYFAKEDAILVSKMRPKYCVEIFAKNGGGVGYIPTYNYYKNGDGV